MARRRERKVPHRIADKGFRHEHDDRQTFHIGDQITVVVCRYAGRIVTTIDAPASYRITLPPENISENIPNSSR